MIIDTHIHESKYSLDSKVSLQEIILKAKEIGLDGICITDHDSNEIMDEAHSLSKELDFPIFVGAEVLTHEGDIVVFGLDNLPSEKIHAAELLKIVKSCGGVGISAHPYRQNNRGMGNLIKEIDGLAGVEGFNGNTNNENNIHSYQVASQIKLPIFGASDAHHVHEVGKFATVFPDGIRDVKDLINAVKEGNVYPVVLQNNSYIKPEILDYKVDSLNKKAV